MTVGVSLTQGASVAGIQGIGVRTPNFAAVADATVGFDRLEHKPKGIMLIKGTWSIMVATGIPFALTPLVGATVNSEQNEPKVHLQIAVEHVPTVMAFS